ncbi:MAG: nicotinate-nucleotide adenylyltransferase [Acidiferrobacterales bacterium]
MIGIFGGTFDPIHYGHLRPVAEVHQALQLEKLFLLPASTPPHRQAPVASAEQRLQMTKLALDEFPGMEVDDSEIRRGGISYTVETLEHYRRQYPHFPLCLLLGSDAFATLETWHQWQKLPTLAHLVVMQRPHYESVAVPGWSEEHLTIDSRELSATDSGKIYFHKVTPQDISATGIRQAISEDQVVAALLPSTVIKYIKQHHIYE